MNTNMVINVNGVECWFSNNILHREDGPAMVYPDGGEHWYLNGERHRENGPAVTGKDNTQVWYQHGLCHREDGPAVMVSNEIVLWFIDNCQITSSSQFQRLTNCTDEQLTAMILKYGDIK